MYIPKETADHFAAQGIVVKYYPEATYGDFMKRVWDKEVEGYINYYKNNVRGYNVNDNGHEFANVLFETQEELRQKAIAQADMVVYEYGRVLNSYEYDKLFVEYDDKGTRRTICQKIAGKSKEITIEYVDKLIAKDKKAYNGTYGKFADAMNRILDKLGYKTKFSVYPTTYGIGVWLFYNWNADKNIKEVEAILKANNVEYYNEYSDKHYVYRFKISKKQANIQLASAC